MNGRDLDWALCRVFLAILREGSLSGAARLLRVAHPTVRRQLEALEGGLGTPLFVRSPSGLVATDLALALRPAAEAMEAAFEHLVRTASGAGDAVAGTVRITASEVMAAEVLPPILAALRLRHPALDFELLATDDMADVLRRDADIAIRMLRPTQSDLIARRVARVPLGLFAHRSWLDRHGPPASLDDLVRSRQMIGYDRQTLLIDALAARGLTVAARDFGFRTDDGVAQLAALRAGLGVAICQAPIAARDRELVRLLPQFEAELEIWIVSHPSSRGAGRIRACVEALAEGLAAYAAAD